MVVWQGITQDGTVVPVQITDEGKVVAVGETGPQGPRGEEGPPGPPGQAEWPPNPFEGAALVWMNGEPTWYAEQPTPTPPGLSPVITEVSDNSLLTFESALDTQVFFQNINVYAAEADGTNWTNGGMYKTNRDWSSGIIKTGETRPNDPVANIFDANQATYCLPNTEKLTYDFVDPIPVQSSLRMYLDGSLAWTNFEINERPVDPGPVKRDWFDLTSFLNLESGEGLKSFSIGSNPGVYLQGISLIEIDGALLLNPGVGPYPTGQISSAINNTALLSRVNGIWQAGLYMKANAETMAAWMFAKSKRDSR